jgi:hypothetical protein
VRVGWAGGPAGGPRPEGRAGRTRAAAATIGPLAELAAFAGYHVESAGSLPLLRYVTAVRPVAEGDR